MKNSILLFGLSLLLLTGCELYTQDDYQEYYVVESYLVANNHLPPLLLSRTTAIDEEFNYEEAAVAGADVQIRRLNPDSSVADSYPYEEQRPGLYIPRNTMVAVQDSTLYQLYITLSDGDSIEAKTLVPGDFETVDELDDQYVYQGGEQVNLTTTPSYYPGRQTFYVFTVNAQDTADKNLTPFYEDLVIENDNDVTSYYVNSSGIINESNYEAVGGGNISLDLPWLAVAFYGDNLIIANAIDDNMYDFLRTQSVQTGGSTLSPGEIQNIEYNINGGIGIFGSMASDTNLVEILKPEQNE